MSRVVIYPFKLASASSKAIAEALKRNEQKTLRVYPDRNYVNRGDDFIVNWGNANEPEWAYQNILNTPTAVATAVNKLETFVKLTEAEVRTVPWTTNIDVARGWDLICERHQLRAHGGAGIRVSTPETVYPAPLYTEMLTPCDEYRVHIFKGEVIDYTKKVKKVDGEFVTAPEEHIKNKEHGLYFLRDVRPREGVVLRAIQAIEALGLDFGAVDIIRHNNRSYVLEVNTAVGLSPVGVEAYANAIMQHAAQ